MDETDETYLYKHKRDPKLPVHVFVKGHIHVFR